MMPDDNALTYASKCYDFEVNAAVWVNSGSNRVYKIQKSGQNFYLRISTRALAYIAAEMDWIDFLKDSVNAPALVKSNNNKSIELYQDGETAYVLCLFFELPGVFWNKDNASTWNETVFYNWGSTMGKMHRMTKKYHPPEGALKRPLFEDNFISLDYYKNIPAVYKKMAQIQKEILTLPRDSDSYGLIHCDMHQQNLLINDDNISVLDFDDCKYGFFALDIGIALYHALWWGLPDDIFAQNGFALKIIRSFMSGYKAENSLSDFWLGKILLFMQYRQIAALSWHLSYYKPKAFDEVVFNDCFHISYDFGEHIRFIENDIFYEECTIRESDFISTI